MGGTAAAGRHVRPDGNAFRLIARVREQIRGEAARAQFVRQALYGCKTYDAVLRLCLEHVEVVDPSGYLAQHLERAARGDEP